MSDRWSIKTASEAVGGLSNPSKMPSFGTSTPAYACPVGSRLAGVTGSVCEGCYATKGSYTWANVEAALERRLAILQACEHDEGARDRWVSAMAFLLNARAGQRGRNDGRYFRWHDSGDIQGVWHLDMIVEVAARTPAVTHWLPTREISTVRKWLAAWGDFPFNLTVRVSAAMVGARLPRIPGTVASGVHRTKGAPENGAVECGAIYNRNECGDCRACWDPGVPEISYLKH